MCEEDLINCACIATKNAGKGASKLVIGPKDGKHVAYCVGTTSVCVIAWLTVVMPKAIPASEGLSAALAAGCVAANNYLEVYERS
jgi:hypothetical protein